MKCNEGFSHDYGVGDDHEFVCSDGEDAANGGIFKCGENCPTCNREYNYKLSGHSSGVVQVNKGVGEFAPEIYMITR